VRPAVPVTRERAIELPTIAIEIVAAHQPATSAARSALEYARRAGNLLLEAKTCVARDDGCERLGLECVRPRTWVVSRNKLRIGRCGGSAQESTSEMPTE
jgi:hypothetical protein